MLEIIRIIIATLILILGVPIGIFLAKSTKKELEKKQRFFKSIIIINLIAGLVSLLIQNDALMFSFFFIAIVTSQSIIRNKMN